MLKLIMFAFVTVFVFSAAAEAQEKPIPAAIEDVIDKAIRPGFAALAERAGSMAGAMDALCTLPSETELSAARAHFDALAAACRW